jgi:hypothetical protein
MKKLLVAVAVAVIANVVPAVSAFGETGPGWGLTGAGGGLGFSGTTEHDFNVSAHSDVGGANATGQMHLLEPSFGIDSQADVTCLAVIPSFFGTTRAAALGKLQNPVTLAGITFDFGGLSVADTPSGQFFGFELASTGGQATCFSAAFASSGPVQRGLVVIHGSGQSSDPSTAQAPSGAVVPIS